VRAECAHDRTVARVGRGVNLRKYMYFRNQSPVSTYFYPMFDPPENTYQPNAVCVKGSLSISFLSGS
jgi:hypothetical protein